MHKLDMVWASTVVDHSFLLWAPMCIHVHVANKLIFLFYVHVYAQVVKKVMFVSERVNHMVLFEVCIDEIWGLIIDHGWSDNDTTVVCRQLGYGPHGEKLKGHRSMCRRHTPIPVSNYCGITNCYTHEPTQYMYTYMYM